MKFKKAFIFICLVICLLSIAGVSAGDVDEAIAASSDDQIIGIENQENVGVAEEETLSTSTGTFTELANEIANANGELTLTKNYAYEKPSMMMNSTFAWDSLYRNGITIDKEITINGNGFTIDGKNEARVFNVTHENVVLKNINFINAYASDKGGAIFWIGDYGVLSNCNFEGCSASGSSSSADLILEGGAVCWYGSHGVLNDCSFMDCSVSSSNLNLPSNSRLEGGAVNFDSAYGVLSNCSFLGCHISTPDTPPVAPASNFYSYSIGGAVCCVGYRGVLEYCSFINCSITSATDYLRGGAAYCSNWACLLRDCSFIDCFVLAPSYYSNSKGGAVYWDYEYGNLINCSFNNDSAEFGGAVYWNADDGVLRDCSFIDCSASDCGGAIRWNGMFGALSNCTFVDCSAGNEGGAIYWYGSNGYLSDSTFVNCNSSQCNAVYGIEATDCKFMEKPFVSISSPTVKYGQNAKVTVNLASDVPGNVRFTVNGVTEKVKITNAKATCTVSGLNAGTYDVKVTYAGNYKYIADSISTTIKVNKNNPILSVVAKDCGYGTDATITVNLAQNVPGNVRITANGITHVCKISNCAASLNIPGLSIGAYSISIYYAGNANYNAQTVKTTLNVVKGTPIISVSSPNVGYGKNAVITVNVASDVPGNVWFTINDVSEKVKIENGKAIYTLSNLKIGSYNVTIRYAGNVNYNAQTVKTTLNVVKGTPITSVSVKNTNVGDIAVITVNMANNVNGFVKITVNNVTERVQIVNGVATLNVTGLKAGTYDVKAVYAGNANFNAQTKTSTFTVNKISPGLSFTATTKSGKTTITASIAPDAPGNVKVIVDGATTYTAKITNGVATYVISGLSSGSHTIKVTYAGNYKYTAQNRSKTITV